MTKPDSNDMVRKNILRESDNSKEYVSIKEYDFNQGVDYAVYVNNAREFDGLDAGARPDETVSWKKMLPEANMIKLS